MCVYVCVFVCWITLLTHALDSPRAPDSRSWFTSQFEFTCTHMRVFTGVARCRSTRTRGRCQPGCRAATGLSAYIHTYIYTYIWNILRIYIHARDYLLVYGSVKLSYIYIYTYVRIYMYVLCRCQVWLRGAFFVKTIAWGLLCVNDCARLPSWEWFYSFV